MRRRTVANLVNFAGFQACWFACVLGAAAGWPWLGPVVVAVLLVPHLLTRKRPRAEAILLVGAAALGWLADSALVLAGWISFPEVARLGGPSTLWMVAMWVNLAATLDASLGWLRGRLVLAAALGAIGGPLAYAAGARLGAIMLGSPPAWSLVLVGVEWLIAMPLLAWAAQRLHGSGRAAAAFASEAPA